MGNALDINLIHPPPGTLSVVAAQRVMDLRRVAMVDADGNFVLGGQTAPLAANVLTYTSQIVTQADFTSGETKSIALADEPTNIVPIACYVVTTGGPVIGTINTSGLTVEVGTSGDPDSLMKSVSVFGTAGRKGGARGDDVNSYRTADALEIKFTSVGGVTKNLTDITGLSIQVVLLYVKAPV